MKTKIIIVQIKDNKHQLKNLMVVKNNKKKVIIEIIIKVKVKYPNNKIFKIKNFLIFLKKKFLIEENIKKQKHQYLYLKEYKL